MASYRNVSMSFWTDGKVVDDFTPEDKYFYLYCLTNPHTTLCGCYEISLRQMANETGYSTDSIERLLRRMDEAHDVIRYNASTKELLILRWFKYNWTDSEKINKPLLEAIRKIKHPAFREYLAGAYNARKNVDVPYEPSKEPKVEKPKVERHKYGKYGWVRLSDKEFERLLNDLGDAELQRCIAYIDESAQSTTNKNGWTDWNLVIRRCHRNGWGLDRGYGQRQSAAAGAMQDIQAIHAIFDEEGA